MNMLLKKIHVSDVKTVARPEKHSQNKTNSSQINKQSVRKKIKKNSIYVNFKYFTCTHFE